MKMKTGGLLGGFTVRPFQRTDIGCIERWLAEPAMQRALEDERTDVHERRRDLGRLARSTPARHGRGGFVVERHGAPSGFIHLMWINWISRTGEVDLLVAPSRMRSVCGFAVIQKAGEVAFERLNLNKVYGFVYADNAASLSFLGRVMSIEATQRSAALREGAERDVHVVSITATQYYSLKQSLAWDDHR